MSYHKSIRPEDILADGQDRALINGAMVRKGTIGAFLANIEIYENLNATTALKDEALKTMKELAPAIVKIGLSKHVTFKNTTIAKILLEAENT